jgi:type III secretion protein J
MTQKRRPDPARWRTMICVAAATLFLQACQENLYTNLSEREANTMVAALLRSGIPASRTVQGDGKMTIEVDKDRLADAVRVLEDAGLPKPSFASMGDVFQRDGLVASPTQERAQMVFALSEELSRTISEIDGVLSARVHVVLPDANPLRRDDSPSSASVFVRYEPSLDINPLIPQIKTLVANGIAGLSYDKVSVVPVASARSAETAAAPAPELRTVLGVWMLAGSVGRAMLIVGGLALSCAALAVALGVVLVRQRRSRTYRLAVAK